MTWWHGYNSSRFATQRKHEIHPSWHFGEVTLRVSPFWAIHSLSNSPSRCTDDSRSFHWHPRICDMVSTGNQSLGFQFNDFFQQVRSPDTALPPMNCCSFWRTNEVTRKSHCKKVADMPYVTYTKFPTLATMKNIGIWPSNLAWIESDLHTEENSMKYEPKTTAGFCDPSLNRQAYCWKPIIKEWTLERPMSHQTPWSVSNPPNICWIPEDLQEFQETLSAKWRYSWALIAQPRASKLRPSAHKTCRLFDFVWLWDVWWSLQLLPLDPSPLATHIFPTTSTFNSVPMLFSSQMSSPIRFINFTQTFHTALPSCEILECMLFFSSLCYCPYFSDNSLTFSALYIICPFFPCKASTTSSILSPKHFQHLMPSYAVYSYKLQHCFFSTSSTTSSSLPILCF